MHPTRHNTSQINQYDNIKKMNTYLTFMSCSLTRGYQWQNNMINFFRKPFYISRIKDLIFNIKERLFLFRHLYKMVFWHLKFPACVFMLLVNHWETQPTVLFDDKIQIKQILECIKETFCTNIILKNFIVAIIITLLQD